LLDLGYKRTAPIATKVLRELCRGLFQATKAGIDSLAAQQATLKQELEQNHRSSIKHTQALTTEMTHLAEGYKQLESCRQQQQTSVAELKSHAAVVDEAHTQKLQELGEQIACLQRSSQHTHGYAVFAGVCYKKQFQLSIYANHLQG
jgi:chromosome segregation ATPase